MSIGACELTQGKLKDAAKHSREAIAVEGLAAQLKKDCEAQLTAIDARRAAMRPQIERQIKQMEASIKRAKEALKDLGEDEASKKDAG